jgi:hypothetical protein
VLAGVLRDAEMVRLANVSWAVENLLKRTIPRVAQAADYADEGARAVIHALLLNLFVFLEHCMTMTRGNDPDVAYLFEAGEKRLRSGQPTTAIVFMAQLYGGPIERFRLAELAAPIADFTEPVIIHVDYQNNRIERLTLAEHVVRVAAVHGNWTTPASTSPGTA